jgi:hypothetical protein
LILTPLVYLGIKDIHLLVLAFATYGFFIQGTFAWTPTLKTRHYTPVMLAPGRCRLVTRPLLTGSLPVRKMIGIVAYWYFLGHKERCILGEVAPGTECRTFRLDEMGSEYAVGRRVNSYQTIFFCGQLASTFPTPDCERVSSNIQREEPMNRLAIAVLCLVIGLPAVEAVAQEKQRASFKTSAENTKYTQQHLRNL